jgi:hypothetical protein
MIEQQVEIRTQDGRMNTFICHPERLSPHPAAERHWERLFALFCGALKGAAPASGR